MGNKKRFRNNASHDEDERVIMGCEAVYLWVDPVVSGCICLSVLVALFSITYYSFLSVLAYSALFVLGSTAGVRLYVYIAVNLLSKQVIDPLKKYAELDPTVSEDRMAEICGKAADGFNYVVIELRRLFFLDDLLDSLKFGLSLWFLTYVGSWFNFMTLVIMTWVGLFTLPKIYYHNRKSIDPLLDQVKTHLDTVFGKVRSVMPAKTKEDTKKEE